MNFMYVPVQDLFYFYLYFWAACGEFVFYTQDKKT